jgi:hypothetical protein
MIIAEERRSRGAKEQRRRRRTTPFINVYLFLENTVVYYMYQNFIRLRYIKRHAPSSCAAGVDACATGVDACAAVGAGKAGCAELAGAGAIVWVAVGATTGCCPVVGATLNQTAKRQGGKKRRKKKLKKKNEVTYSGSSDFDTIKFLFPFFAPFRRCCAPKDE